MASAIPIGSQLVPIVKEKLVEGSPNGNLVYQLPSNEKISVSNADAEWYYERSITVSDAFAITDQLGQHTSSRYDFFGAGWTDLHNGATFYLGDVVDGSEGSSYPTKSMTQLGQYATNLNPIRTENNWLNMSAKANWPSVNSSYNRSVRICAIRIKYTGVSYYNYQFILTRRQEQVSPSSTSRDYAYIGERAINIYYWQKNGINAYFEEQYIPDYVDPNDEDEPSDEDGGDGDHNKQFDPIPIPNKPTQGAGTAGFITLYKMSQGHMQQFADDMFASDVWEAIKLFFGNPMDFLVGILLLPFEPTGGPSYKPKFGAVSFAHAFPTVANQYVDVDCGSVQIKKYWGSFLDFAPYTKLQIWLPYIGYRDLDVDEVMDQTLSVLYRCDCVTGDCVAFLHIGVVSSIGPQVPRVIGQFYGNCGVQIPFASVTYDQAIASGIEMIGASATWGLSGGSALMDSESVVSAGVNTVNALKPEVEKGGGCGSTLGYMSIQKPYIIRKIARQNLPADYMKFKGYPSNISGKLADFSGFAKVDDIQLNNIPAMEDERKEIMELLKGGVLL